MKSAKSWMPWVLPGALAAGVGIAVFSSSSVPEKITAAPVEAPAPGDRADDLVAPPGGGGAEGMGGAMGGPPAPPEQTLTGTVRERRDVSQYTYLRLANDGGETWAAVYRAPVKAGDLVTVEHASVLHGFHSAELGRDFDEIWFGTLPGYETAPPAALAPATAAAPGSAKAAAGTTSIAELAKNPSAFEGNPVTVSGHVVKVNNGILGRNWLHLQDGTGSAADGSNDVLVTSSEGTAKVGDSVVATGIVRLNQDFGSGYAYKFMIEKGSFRAP